MKQIDVEKRRFTDSQPSLPLDAASVVSVRPGGSLTGQYGGEVELHCEGAGSPSPNLSWQQTSARGVAGRCALHRNHICHIFINYVLYVSLFEQGCWWQTYPLWSPIRGPGRVHVPGRELSWTRTKSSGQSRSHRPTKGGSCSHRRSSTARGRRRCS